jgi:hypothetical protein
MVAKIINKIYQKLIDLLLHMEKARHCGGTISIIVITPWSLL